MGIYTLDVILDNFNNIYELIKKFPIITIYDHPLDYPEYYVARIFDLDKPTRYIMLKKDLEEIRSNIPTCLSKFLRYANDDKVIIETWL